MDTEIGTLPGVGRPCVNALAEAGVITLSDANSCDYHHLLSLHGVGPKGLQRVLAALREAGGDMANAPAHAAPSGSRVTKGHTGTTAKDVKTRPTDVDPAEFIEGLEWPRRVAHGRELLALFNQVTGEKPVMWGPTMVGYGEVHYVSSAGREGDWFNIGFSPRKASLSIYGMQAAPRFEELAAQLGKHKLGAGCLYINKLEDVDMDVFREMVREAWGAPLDGASGC